MYRSERQEGNIALHISMAPFRLWWVAHHRTGVIACRARPDELYVWRDVGQHSLVCELVGSIGPDSRTPATLAPLWRSLVWRDASTIFCTEEWTRERKRGEMGAASSRSSLTAQEQPVGLSWHLLPPMKCVGLCAGFHRSQSDRNIKR